MFLSPEVTAIGLNAQQAQDSRIPYCVSVYGYSLVNQAITIRATDGFAKLLVRRRRYAYTGHARVGCPCIHYH